MKIAIGCDHAGPELKAEILAHLDEKGVEYTDFGIQAGEKVDYPDKAKEVCESRVETPALFKLSQPKHIPITAATPILSPV